MSPKDAPDRRKILRYPAKKGAFVNLVGDAVKPWQILDVGLGGLAFRYLQGFLGPVNASEMDILTSDAGFCLEGIPCYIVTDLDLPGQSFGQHTLRRCCVQYGNISQEQRSSLGYFIEKYTTREAG